jgi:hypothetical protein
MNRVDIYVAPEVLGPKKNMGSKTTNDWGRFLFDELQKEMNQNRADFPSLAIYVHCSMQKISEYPQICASPFVSDEELVAIKAATRAIWDAWLCERDEEAKSAEARDVLEATKPLRDAAVAARLTSEPWRGTGRTTAMVAKAREAAQVGQRVVVVWANDLQAREWDPKLREGTVSPSLVTTCSLVSDGDPLRGYQFDRLFVDHFAWEVDPIRTAILVAKLAPSQRRS